MNRKAKSRSPYYHYGRYIEIMYGLTIKEYERMLEEQKGLCAICAKPETRKKQRRLCVDHCHETGKIRGLLCQRCNSVLGYMKDDPNLLQSAVEYLNTPGSCKVSA